MDPIETFRMIIRSALDLSLDPGNGDCREDFKMHLVTMKNWLSIGGFMFSHEDLIRILTEENK